MNTMSQPGWYPDPSGSGGPRYWDGHQWTAGPTPEQGSKTLWWVVGGIILVGLVVVALIFWPSGRLLVAPPAPDDRSDRPTVQPWNEISEEPTEPEESSLGSMEECPYVGSPHSQVDPDGRQRGGGMSVVAPTAPGWSTRTTYMPWMFEQNSTLREVVPEWVASIDIGRVRAEDGFTDPKQAANAMKSCMASSWLFNTFSHVEVLKNEPFSIDGHDGWYLQVEIHVNREDWVQGDLVDIYVVDTGLEGELSVLVGCATIDDQASISEVRESLDTLRIE